MRGRSRIFYYVLAIGAVSMAASGCNKAEECENPEDLPNYCSTGGITEPVVGVSASPMSTSPIRVVWSEGLGEALPELADGQGTSPSAASGPLS